VDWVHLAQDQWCAVMKAVVNPSGSITCGEFFLPFEDLLASSDRLLHRVCLLPNYLVLWIVCYSIIIFSGSAAQRGLWPPRPWSFLITHNDAPQSVGLLWASDQLVAETSTWQLTTYTTEKHLCPWWDSNSRSQQASGRRPIDPRLRPRGNWDRHCKSL
jgi:hypothetical protein